jgi:uncharacterized FlaG/YvyC family protein
MSHVTATSSSPPLWTTTPRVAAAGRAGNPSQIANMPDSSAAADAKSPPPDVRELQEAVTDVNALLRESGIETHDVGLAYRDGVDHPVVEVRDRESGDLLAQFPPESILTMRQRMREFLGTLLDRKS